MKPYKDGFQVGHCGTDDPATAESQAFIRQTCKDVPMDPLVGDWVGTKDDFVDIGLVSGAHGTRLARIAAANGMFGGRMNGAAPGPKIVSERACLFAPGCTSVAMTEGMVDLVNMSIGDMAALNDGGSATTQLYNHLIDTYGVQFVIAVGNSGPGANTIEGPGLADKVVSVGASISKQTLAANYASGRGQHIPTWMLSAMDGHPGWTLPPGYAMWNGTLMASPQAAGASALLLSAAKKQGIEAHAREPAHGAYLDRPAHGSSGVPGRRWPHRRRRRVEGGPGRARPPTTTR
jgi:subtilisin family serine protease